jgi:hypothetical protein
VTGYEEDHIIHPPFCASFLYNSHNCFVTIPAKTCQGCCCINESAAEIGIALTDAEVDPYMREPYSIAEVNSNATTTMSLNGSYVTIQTYDVMIDASVSIVYVHVDVQNCNVLGIWSQYKRPGWS